MASLAIKNILYYYDCITIMTVLFLLLLYLNKYRGLLSFQKGLGRTLFAVTINKLINYK
jgi:hypothetical protein